MGKSDACTNNGFYALAPAHRCEDRAGYRL
jgi:hypothetical protein